MAQHKKNRKEQAFDKLHGHFFPSEDKDPIMCEYCGTKPATHTDYHGTPDEEPRDWDVCEPCKDELVKKFTAQLKRAGII